MPAADQPQDVDELRRIDGAADEFELVFHAGETPRIEDYLPRVPAALRPRLLGELVRIELEWLQRRGETVAPQEYLQRFPNDGEIVRQALRSSVAAPESMLASTAPAGETQRAPAAGRVPVCPGRFGRFDLQRVLGAGGFGTVYLAADTQLGRLVALKIPRVSDGNRRFLAEARAAAKLQHPNIVTVFDSGILEDQLYIVCEFVEGADLAETVRSSARPLRQLAAWIRDVARALAYSHAQGVVHRDIKPGNLLISRGGQAYIADFGLARQVEESSSLTADGSVLGTPAYMSPEQAAGRTSEIGAHSDQYSLGVVLYELLTGRRPFLGNVREVLQQVIHARPPAPRSLYAKIPAELEAICLKAMARLPQDRYPSMNDFADDLDRWLVLRANQPRSRGAHGFDWSAVRRSTGFKIGGAVAAAGVVAAGLAYMLSGSEATVTSVPPAIQPGPAALVQPVSREPLDAAVTRDSPVDAQAVSAGRRRQLVEATAVGQAWELPPVANLAGSRRCVMSILDCDEARSRITAVFWDADDPSRREAWTGELQELGREYSDSGASWVADFHPASGPHQLPSPQTQRVVLAPRAEGELNWIDAQPVQAVHRAANAPAGFNAAAASERIRTASRPGSTWEGTLQEPGEATRLVRLTFTENRDGGQHVRATLEAVDSPFNMAPFIGTINYDPVALIVGRPIRLVRKAGFMGAADDWPIFAHPWLDPEIQLSLEADGALVGTAGSAALRLTRAADHGDGPPRADQWRAAVEAGAVWRGVMKFSDEPPIRVRLTMAEVRDDHAYVRMLADDEDHVHRFAVYEGTLNLRDDAIDGYALSCTLRARGPDVQQRQRGLFGSSGALQEVKQVFRLSADGRTLLGRTGEGERITLERDPENAPLALDRTAFRERWRQIAAPGRIWQGSLHNTEHDQRTGITFAFAGPPDTLGNVQCIASVADRPLVRMIFTGTLDADSDVAVNAYALRLTKAGAGQGPSVLFGARRGAEVQLRLSSDGTRLIGMAGFDGRWTELLELSEPVGLQLPPPARLFQ